MDIWKPIPGYEGLYDASDSGHIRTSPGKVTSNARYKKRVWKSKVLKEKIFKSKKGREDARVELWKDGKHKTYLVARLVASAWHGYPPDGMTVNHINGNSLDNRQSNLEWVSLSENIKKGFDGGLYAANQKPILLVSGAVSIRFESMSSASRWLGRCNGYISDAIKNAYTISDAASGTIYRVAEA